MSQNADSYVRSKDKLILSKCKVCSYQTLDQQYLIGKLRQILACLQKQIENKNDELEKIKEQYQKELKIKDEVIERLVKANDKVSEQNIKIKKLIENSKYRTNQHSRIFINVNEVNRDKANISQLMTFDNSFINRTQASNNSIRSEEKNTGRIIKNAVNQQYLMKSCGEINFQKLNSLRKSSIMKQQQNLKRIRSSAFIGKKTYNYLNYIPRSRKMQQSNNLQNQQSTPYNKYNKQQFYNKNRKINTIGSIFKQIY